MPANDEVEQVLEGRHELVNSVERITDSTIESVKTPAALERLMEHFS